MPIVVKQKFIKKLGTARALADVDLLGWNRVIFFAMRSLLDFRLFHRARAEAHLLPEWQTLCGRLLLFALLGFFFAAGSVFVFKTFGAFTCVTASPDTLAMRVFLPFSSTEKPMRVGFFVFGSSAITLLEERLAS